MEKLRTDPSLFRKAESSVWVEVYSWVDGYQIKVAQEFALRVHFYTEQLPRLAGCFEGWSYYASVTVTWGDAAIVSLLWRARGHVGVAEVGQDGRGLGLGYNRGEGGGIGLLDGFEAAEVFEQTAGG